MYACFTLVPQPHPWEPRILDVACGYFEKNTDLRCQGCYRCRDELPGQQLINLNYKLNENALK